MDNDTIQEESSNAEVPAQNDGKKSIKIKISVKTAVIIAIIIAVLIILGALAYVYKGLFIAATVDGDFITRLSVIRQLEKTSGKGLLESLIEQKLIESEVKARKIAVSEDEINGEIKKIENQLSFQGTNLDTALAGQGMSLDDLKKRIRIQMAVEKMVADKVSISDEEVAQYIKDNQISIPEGQEAATAGQIKNQLRNQKLNTEAQALLADLKTKAKIRYFVNY